MWGKGKVNEALYNSKKSEFMKNVSFKRTEGSKNDQEARFIGVF